MIELNKPIPNRHHIARAPPVNTVTSNSTILIAENTVSINAGADLPMLKPTRLMAINTINHCICSKLRSTIA
ncbi:hypothetical protein D3C80_1889420 [compost metagenome]